MGEGRQEGPAGRARAGGLSWENRGGNAEQVELRPRAEKREPWPEGRVGRTGALGPTRDNRGWKAELVEPQPEAQVGSTLDGGASREKGGPGAEPRELGPRGRLGRLAAGEPSRENRRRKSEQGEQGPEGRARTAAGELSL